MNADQLIAFAAGGCYGLTSVVVGQPFDTLKTRMQARPANLSTGAFQIARSLFATEGLKGLYRGGLPLFIGGSLFRSAQFGVYDNVLSALRSSNLPKHRIGGVLDYQVVFAGFCGGLGRGIVEGPFEFVKVRRQVDCEWSIRNIYKGSGVTILRNAFLFSSFVIYIDLSKQIVDGGLSPFMTGAICSNLAWLTVWPLDVLKSQVQSGNYKDHTTLQLLKHIVKSGKMFRGIVPGLIRSTLANGCSMEVYHYVQHKLQPYSTK